MTEKRDAATDGDSVRDALDHIMRVSRQGISPTKRLDWIEIRARYALEGKPWSPDIRETPRDSVKKMEKDFAKCRAELAARSERAPKFRKASRIGVAGIQLLYDTEEQSNEALRALKNAAAQGMVSEVETTATRVAPAESASRCVGAETVDAARYRWLNKQHNFLIYIDGMDEMRSNVRLRCGVPLDSYIDNRIAEES